MKPLDFLKGFIPHPASQAFFKGDLSEEEIEGWAKACFLSSVPVQSQFKQNIRRAHPAMRIGLGRALGNLEYDDETEIIRKLKIPFGIFHGELEPFVRLDYLQSLDAPTLWRGKVQIIPGGGHYPHIEEVEKFNALLDAFVTDVSRS
jgi:pimeloyl-ACP methyl ester carboxylesterase